MRGNTDLSPALTGADTSLLQRSAAVLIQAGEWLRARDCRWLGTPAELCWLKPPGPAAAEGTPAASHHIETVPGAVSHMGWSGVKTFRVLCPRIFYICQVMERLLH